MLNVLYIHTHDSGRYFDPYGYAVGTPAISRLAHRGTLFRRAFSAAPTCSPSRAGLLTGTSPHRSGMLGLAHRGFRLHDYGDHLVQQCRSAGFRTVLSGIQHEADPVELIGYDRVLDDSGIAMGHGQDFDTVTYDLKNAGRAAAFLTEHAADERPFFLSFGMFNTHREFPEVDEQVEPNHVLPPREVVDSPAARRDFAGYITSARVVDRCVGMITETMTTTNLWANTMVIFTTDHGIAYPHNKCSLYDTGTGVALILAFPGNPAAGRAVDAMVSHLDVFPTLCDVVRLPKPAHLEGRSLMPLLTGNSDSVHDTLFSEITFHAGYQPQRAVRTERYKLIKHFADPPAAVAANIDRCPSKDDLFGAGYAELTFPAVELYDLIIDPLERVNRADDPSYAVIRESLEDQLERWMERTEDPLRNGPVPLPPGAVQDPPGAYDPEDLPPQE